MIRIILTFLTVYVVVTASAAGKSVKVVSSIKRLGITWTFEKPVTSGSFANGDPWVLAPVTILSVSPGAVNGRHGIMVNPADQAIQAYDDRFFGYSPDALATFPQTLEKPASIVKTLSVPESKKKCRPCVKQASVLTVLLKIPEDGGATSFRPPVFGLEKPVFSTKSIDWTKIPQMQLPRGGVSLFDISRQYSMTHLDHMSNWMGLFMHPKDAMPDYGANIAKMNANNLIGLLGRQKPASKEKALIRYLNNGIDLVYMMKGGVRWPNNGGHSGGRKLPIAFTAFVLNLPDIFDHPAYAALDSFGENSSVRPDQSDQVMLFGPDNSGETNYWNSAILDKGSRTVADPYGYIDGGQRPGTSYQFCCLSQPWKATTTAARLVPGLEERLSLPDLAKYVQRWEKHGTWTSPDVCAPITGVCKGGASAGAFCTSANAEAVCGEGKTIACDYSVRMKTDFKVKYGPDGNGSCIRDMDPSDGIGRYPQLHGSKRGEGYYRSKWVDEIWLKLQSGAIKPGAP